MRDLELEYHAQLFATAAHAATGQLRKHTGEAYIVHPQEVVEILRNIDANSNMIAAAWLHDVVEDTKVSIFLIQEVFGETVAKLVGELTDVYTVEKWYTMNRAERKSAETLRIAGISAEAQTIKLADMISNTKSIAAHDPKFAVTYFKEKRELLKVLTKGSRRLFMRAHMITQAKEWKLDGY